MLQPSRASEAARHGRAATPIAIVHGQLGIGGSERQLYYLLRECDRSTWQPHLFISGHLGQGEHEIQALDIPITLLTGTPYQKLLQLRRGCKEAGAACMISWSSYTNLYAIGLAGLGIPTIGSFRNARFADLPQRGRRAWGWLSQAAVASVLCNSTETAEALSRDGRSRRPVLYLPNAVEAVPESLRHRSEWRGKLGIGPDEVLVLGAGRLTKQKNFVRFVEAVAVAARLTPLRAVIAGPDMGEGPAITAAIDATGLPPGTIRLLGAVPDARTLVAAADVLLLSSDHEGMPNVVMEAMSLGVPCVSTDVNGISSLLTDGDDGFVTDKSAGALAERLVRLARKPELRAEIGRRARTRVIGYTPDAVYGRLWTSLPEIFDMRAA